MALDFPAQSEGAVFTPPTGVPFVSVGGNWRRRGGMIVIGRKQATTNVANLTLELPAAFTRFDLMLRGVEPVNYNVSTVLCCQISQDGGSTWGGATDYGFGGVYATIASGANGLPYNAASAGMLQIGGSTGTTYVAGHSGFVQMFISPGTGSNTGAVNWRVVHTFQPGNVPHILFGAGFRGGNTRYTHVKIYYSPADNMNFRGYELLGMY